MKIGFVLDDGLDKPDGVQQYILTLGAWYRSHGHEVHYLVGQTKRTDIENTHSLSRNVSVQFNQNRMSTPLPASKNMLRDLLAREQFDVLHIQMPYSPFMAGRVILAAPRRTAIVGTFHILAASKIVQFATRGLGLMLKRTLKRFDVIVAVSPPASVFLRQTFGVDSVVIPNAVNVDAFRSSNNRNHDGIHIVFLGRLVQRKGCQYLLQTLSVLQKSGDLDNVRVTIAGKGKLYSQLQQYSRDNELDSTVTFLGFIDEAEKPALLASADIAVFPSDGGESFGIVLIEAMAAGSGAVIGGNNPGYASVLGEHPDQLVSPRDTQAFAAVLKRYIKDPVSRSVASKWQAEEINTYDVAVIGEQLLSVYREAIAKKQQSRDNGAQA